MQSDQVQPVELTVNRRLDAALQAGWEAWEETARAEGADKVAAWLAQRFRDPGQKANLRDTLQAMWAEDEAEDRAFILAELAEIAEAYDALVADTLWEGVLAIGRDEDDGDLIFEATTHLATIAEDHGEPLVAAEYYIDFLNWRRQDEHTSDVESVEAAFEEIIRLAHLDGEPRAAAIYEYRQAQYTRLAETEDDRATTGDWERTPAPYQSWA